VDPWGKIDINQLKEALTENTLLISLMHVNNEVGTIQPIEEISKLLVELKSKPFLHVDAIQSFGKLKLNVGKLGIDMLSISGHKIHGPKGIGAVFIRKGLKVSPLFMGGNQEIGIRSGTENVPGIVGLGVAAEKIWNDLDNHYGKLIMLKERFLGRVKSEIPNVKVNSLQGDAGAPQILNISFMGIRGEVLLHSLEQDGIYVSTGSACSSKKNSQSHVLKAMKLKDDEIEGAIRFSFSYNNTVEEIDYAVDQLKKHVEELRKIMMR
jgi:cysteine desulfurase